VHSPLNGNPAAAIAVRPKQDTNLRIIKMKKWHKQALGGMVGIAGLICVYNAVGGLATIGVFLMALGHNMEKDHG
jgi:hypothetical protein